MKLKEKIESISTLQAGIVYGKEDAWDKLQARLDKKPARVVPVYYKMVAAAVLLIVVSIVGYDHFQKPGKERTLSTIADKPENISTRPAMVTIAPTNSDTYTTINVVAATHLQRAVPNLKSAPILTSKIRKIIQYEVTQLPMANISLIHTEQPKMRVLHINELDKPDVSEAIADKEGDPAPSLAKATMRVVHINDLVKEDYTESLFLRENKTVNSITFMKPVFSYMPNSYTGYDKTSRGIKINIRAQN